jgi:ABC-2 type transport system permease protein
VNSPSLAWFAEHEARLVWREATWWLRGKHRRLVRATLALVVVAAILHGVAYLVVSPYAAWADRPDKLGFLILSTMVLSGWMLVLSQALETVTRALYARGDTDLILSSPASVRGLFALRLAATAGASTLMALLLTAPFVHMMAYVGGPRWLSAYGVLVAMGASAAACAIMAALALFRLIGPVRTRAVAQIVAAVVGAGIVIGLQVAAVLGNKGLERFAVLREQSVIAAAPDLDSPLWWLSRALLGEGLPLVTILAGSVLLLAGVVTFASKRFADHMLSAASTVRTTPAGQGRAGRLVARSPRVALRLKELKLLSRDPWLLSQSLMQILYLAPPALMLWQGFNHASDPGPLLVPVIVMAAGQLAGGLAWLAISGEDAPDLIATAPVSTAAVLRAKLEAVVIALALPMAPLLLALAFVSPFCAGAAFVGLFCAASASAAIQFLFRGTAQRATFRRRQTASRIATFAEAFSSISWAAAAGLAAAGSMLAIVPATVAAAVLGIAWMLSPKRA